MKIIKTYILLLTPVLIFANSRTTLTPRSKFIIIANQNGQMKIKKNEAIDSEDANHVR